MEIMNIVEHGHQYSVFEGMDINEVIKNHNSINDVIEHSEAILIQNKDNATNKKFVPKCELCDFLQRQQPEWTRSTDGAWILARHERSSGSRSSTPRSIPRE